MSYGAKILADSIGPNGVRLTTMEVTFPRIVLAEFNTHRQFSRNSASSRAIPVEKMLARVAEDPFIPVYWGKNQKGMQADQELTPAEQQHAIRQWLAAADNAAATVRELLDNGVHKQIANRLLEPWLWQTVIVTATEWDNFFALRCGREAQPEIRRVALMMRDLYLDSAPQQEAAGGWHLPLCEDIGQLRGTFSADDIVRISCGRCARVSYLTHDGKRDPTADLQLANRLQKSGHMSPFEHVAQAIQTPTSQLSGNLRGWRQYRKMLVGESVFCVEAA